MNVLLTEIRRSLVELSKGIDGQLNMSDSMEDLSQALSRNEVCGFVFARRCARVRRANVCLHRTGRRCRAATHSTSARGRSLRGSPTTR
jgi:hypothetical protein